MGACVSRRWVVRIVESKWVNSLALVVVLLIHGGALATASLWPPSAPVADQLPTINGVLIDAPPADVVQPPAAASKPPQPEPQPKEKPILSEPKPEPEPKPKPKPKPVEKPQTKAQPEKAVTPPPEPPAETVAADPPPPKTTAATQATPNSAAGAPVTVPRIDAKHRNNPAPAYPRLSRRRGEEGTVVLELMVLKDGTVEEITIKESSGYPRLDKSAMEAVRRWKYNPATRGGQPIDYRYLQPVTFSLKG